MKFLLLSDIHATSKSPVSRKDNILDAFIKKFSFVLEYADEHDCTILQAGDFFHRPRDWRLLFLAMDLIENSDVHIYTIYGQHDLYLYSDVEDSPTTLSILGKAGYVDKLGSKPIHVGNAHIYGCDYESKVPVPKQLDYHDGEVNVLVIHHGIAADGLFPDHDFTSPLHFMKENPGYDLILAGDIHRQFIKKTRKHGVLLNTGPMVRYDGTKYNMTHEPSFFVWDSEEGDIEKVVIPHKPSDKVLNRDHIERSRGIKDAAEAFAEAMKNTEIDEYSVKKIIKRIVKELRPGKRVKKILAEAMSDEY